MITGPWQLLRIHSCYGYTISHLGQYIQSIGGCVHAFSHHCFQRVHARASLTIHIACSLKRDTISIFNLFRILRIGSSLRPNFCFVLDASKFQQALVVESNLTLKIEKLKIILYHVYILYYNKPRSGDSGLSLPELLAQEGRTLVIFCDSQNDLLLNLVVLLNYVRL